MARPMCGCLTILAEAESKAEQKDKASVRLPEVAEGIKENNVVVDYKPEVA